MRRKNMQKRTLRKHFVTRRRMVGKLKWLAVMLGANCIVLLMTKPADVVSFVFLAFGAHREMQSITLNKLKKLLRTVRLGRMILRSNL